MAAQWNGCALCTDVLGAAAARHLGRAVVDAALSDYRSAPITEGLKVTLEFLEIMTLRPRSVTEEKVSAVIDSGISMETLVDAIEVAVVLKLSPATRAPSISRPRMPRASPNSRATGQHDQRTRPAHPLRTFSCLGIPTAQHAGERLRAPRHGHSASGHVMRR